MMPALQHGEHNMTKYLLAAVLVCLTGCASQIPVPTNHELSYQQKAKSVHHWDVLAKDIAFQVKAAVSKEPQLQEKPLFIQLPPESTPFNKAFQSLLVTRLVDNRLPLTTKKEGAVQLEFNTQIVRHNSFRYAHVPGTFTALASGIWVVRDMLTAGSAAIPISLGALGLADYGMGHYAGQATSSELMVTTSIAVDNSYLFRKADFYYIEDPDVQLYEDMSKGNERHWEVTGK
jgi:hypothetical protein